MDVLIILVKNNSNIISGVGRAGKIKSTDTPIPRSMTLEEISKDANRDKTSVFRSLQKSVNLGICNKESKTQKGGGLYHIYSAIDMRIFKMETEKKVKELEASFRRILKQFEEDMENMVKTFYQA